MKFDGIIFDLDGTLWDVTREAAMLWTELLTRYGAKEPLVTREQLYALMGLPPDELPLLARLPETCRAAAAEAYLAGENEYLRLHGASLYPDEETVLPRLAERYALFIVSNCQDGYIQAYLHSSAMGRFFKDFESAGRTGLSKEENIRRMVRKHGLEHPVYIGDTVLDWQSARGAGVPFLHAAYGFGVVRDVPFAAAFRDIPAALEQMGGM